MPINSDDKYIRAIRTPKAPISQTEVKASPASKSLNQITNAVSKSKTLRCEVTSKGELRIDISNLVHGDKIKVSKTNAIKFANWILKSAEGLKSGKASHKDKMDR